MIRKLKPAATMLSLPDGKTVPVLHPNPGDAIAINNEPKTPILGYAHTPDGTNLYVAGKTPPNYRAHLEYPEGESREYFLKKIRGGITELNLPQVQNDITYHPAPLMVVSWKNPGKELPIVDVEFKNAA